MEEQLITFETAKLAKEKGFNELTSYAYLRNFNKKYLCLDDIECKYKNSEIRTHNYAVPTQALLQKWLRKKHNLVLILCPTFEKDGFQYLIGTPCFDVKNGLPEQAIGMLFKNWEEALEKGLQEALKLIK